jgi:hypothetical protein
MRKCLFAVVAAVLVVPLLSMAPASAASNTKKFCAVNLKINLAFDALGAQSNGGQPPAAAIAQAKATIVPLVQQAQQLAPSALTTAVHTAGDPIINNFEAAIQGPPQGPQAVASKTIDKYAVAHCGYHVVRVSAKEFAFKGIPSTIPTGTTIFQLKNVGAQAHEIIVVRIKTKDTVKQLLKLSDQEATKRIETITQTAANPGDTAFAYAKISKRGRYAAVCFISDGTTNLSSPANGKPHALEGMYYEFKVG